MALTAKTGLNVYETSIVEQGGTTYMLIMGEGGAKQLAVVGDLAGFEGKAHAESGALLCDLTPANARTLRGRLAWLSPVAHGPRTSAGFGDRLGIATPGHVQATEGTGVAPIFAQQSVRENTRTGRTPQIVLDDAMWGAFQAGWREAWGADADHMKTVEDIDPFIKAGYSFYTIDPSAYVDDSAEHADADTLAAKVDALPWAELQSSPAALRDLYLQTFDVDGLVLTFDERLLYKAAAKYGGAIAHTARMATHLVRQMGDTPFDLEVSVDETETTTSLLEHFYIASELRRLGVKWVSLAPRFVGRFEKGVDYIGNLNALDENIAGHAAIMRYFGNSYKLSLHTGSDKFGVYPIAVKHCGTLVHLKTAGTSYLEALRVIAQIDPTLFRQILDFARGRYENDRKTYHVSAVLDKVPEAGQVSDAELPGLLDQFDARQVLHVTFGSVLDTFGAQIQALLRAHEAEYEAGIKAHFDRHLAAFRQ
jgi:tagaturonate epimerase